ncbi:MAG: hypothetical protein ABSB09_06000 [Acidimicrobiales bacterium]
MPVVVVVIILVAWAIILGPNLVKRRVRAGDQSITHFHRQLRILEHSAPEPLVAPAYRLQAVDDTGSPNGISYPDTGTRPTLTVVGAKELPRPALAFLGEPEPEPVEVDPPTGGHRAPVDRFDDVGWGEPGRRGGRDAVALRPAPDDPGNGPRGVDSFARSQARRRRRDTLSVLAGVFVASLMLGLIPGASFVWAVSAVDGLALVAYVSVLVHLRRMALERERKLHYLDAGRDRRTARFGDPRPYVGGRYAHPSNGHAAAH